MKDDKILEKVRKLLAMANHENANETERDTAMRQAHALLTKHGLDMAQVNAHEREKVDPRGEFAHEDWSIPWTRSVRGAIAKLFMCKYFYGEKINGTRQWHYYVGRESNATTAEYMSVFVAERFQRKAVVFMATISARRHEHSAKVQQLGCGNEWNR